MVGVSLVAGGHGDQGLLGERPAHEFQAHRQAVGVESDRDRQSRQSAVRGSRTIPRVLTNVPRQGSPGTGLRIENRVQVESPRAV